ncbi:PASTA domain-containing protein [Actinoallomurus iriomotensis]|uniref:PASTA domain-containing protein n=1 Tax=Actinoallomurus iriomotensis TaxID=478107 RepID=A0A9W6W459_9ACTN|nr:PASTA domain-containing protein [Actinoallomurus iriomotensis]GLY90665.1 hypothetical protein Airi02_085940 [Actinoallomurus iriomotensis]
MRNLLIATAAAAGIATLTGCKAETPAPAIPPVASTVTVPAPSTPELPEASTAPTPAQPSVKLIKIPNVVGVNHQTAQDTMQAHGLYNLREQDATGQGRLLLWDRNWVVVRQTPPAGRRVKPDTVITLYSKKIGE